MNGDTGRAKRERFVSEPIQPDRASFDTNRMAAGEPGLPHRFNWRKQEYDVEDVLETWKSTGPCTSGSPEQYVRRHYFKVRTECGEIMTLYCDRQPSKRSGKIRSGWVLYSIAENKE
jgi:hypothetical protein